MFVTNWISTTKIQKISEITNFFRHYFLSRTEVILFPKLQKDLAEDLGMTRQNFNYHWSSAKGQLILDYVEYFKSLISKYNKQ